jgi:phage terminase Nu1 subunit (DNA packaging protein)
MRHEKLTKRELADRFGVDVRSITNWAGLGMPQRKESGKPVFAWPECYAWREEQIRNDARAARHAGGDETTKLKAAELRLRQLEIETENAEMDLAARRGELVPLAFMRSEFARIGDGLRKGLHSMPQTWAERLGATATTIDRQLMLQEAVNDLMPLLREMADSDPDDEGDEPDAAGDDDTPADDSMPPDEAAAS